MVSRACGGDGGWYVLTSAKVCVSSVRQRESVVGNAEFTFAAPEGYFDDIATMSESSPTSSPDKCDLGETQELHVDPALLAVAARELAASASSDDSDDGCACV